MEKTYVFDNSGNESTGLLGSILPCLQSKGIDTGYLLGMLNNCANGGLFGGRGFEDIIALIIVAAIFGNGNGFGFGNSNSHNSTEREMLMSAIQRNGVDINSLASTLHCSVSDLQNGINNVATQICNLAAQSGQNSMQVINAIQSGNNAVTSQLCNCCCDLKQLVTQYGAESRLSVCQQTNTLQNAINGVAVGQERGFSNLAFESQKQTCELSKAIADNTAQVLAGQRAAEMRDMQDKLDALREKNTQQATFINNAQQTAAISAMISPIAAEIEKLKCKLPETVTLPFSCATAVPTNLCYGAYGFSGFGYPYNNSLWG